MCRQLNDKKAAEDSEVFGRAWVLYNNEGRGKISVVLSVCDRRSGRCWGSSAYCCESEGPLRSVYGTI